VVDAEPLPVGVLCEQEGQKQQEGKGPLAEIEFWRARNTALSGIYEQINMPRVRRNVLALL
jgi:dynein heavy chain